MPEVNDMLPPEDDGSDDVFGDMNFDELFEAIEQKNNEAMGIEEGETDDDSIEGQVMNIVEESTRTEVLRRDLEDKDSSKKFSLVLLWVPSKGWHEVELHIEGEDDPIVGPPLMTEDAIYAASIMAILEAVANDSGLDTLKGFIINSVQKKIEDGPCKYCDCPLEDQWQKDEDEDRDPGDISDQDRWIKTIELRVLDDLYKAYNRPKGDCVVRFFHALDDELDEDRKFKNPDRAWKFLVRSMVQYESMNSGPDLNRDPDIYDNFIDFDDEEVFVNRVYHAEESGLYAVIYYKEKSFRCQMFYHRHGSFSLTSIHMSAKEAFNFAQEFLGQSSKSVFTSYQEISVYDLFEGMNKERDEYGYDDEPEE